MKNEALQTIAIAERYSPPAGDYMRVVLQELGSDASDKIAAVRAKSAPLEKRSGVTPKKEPEALKLAETPLEEGRPPQTVSVVKDPAVSEFMSALRLTEVDRDGYVMLKWVKIPPNKIGRVGVFLHRLAEALRPDDLVFDATQGRVGFSHGGATVASLRDLTHGVALKIFAEIRFAHNALPASKLGKKASTNLGAIHLSSGKP